MVFALLWGASAAKPDNWCHGESWCKPDNHHDAYYQSSSPPVFARCTHSAEIIGKHYFSGKSTQDAINMQTVWWPGNKVSMGGEFQLRGSAAFHPVKQ
mmetsp:Transcript_31494/g.73714  ORF Transcript_31494/g.73714 Transcript_31494/m.73714 type:complete len:98 (+) Transcript_31494:116-409(+)